MMLRYWVITLVFGTIFFFVAYQELVTWKGGNRVLLFAALCGGVIFYLLFRCLWKEWLGEGTK